MLTGRLAASQPKWLSGHVVFGKTLFPGTGFLELALAAAQRVGLTTVEELTLEAPLLIPEHGGVQLHVRVEAADERGQRGLTVHARPEGMPTGGLVLHRARVGRADGPRAGGAGGGAVGQRALSEQVVRGLRGGLSYARVSGSSVPCRRGEVVGEAVAGVAAKRSSRFASAPLRRGAARAVCERERRWRCRSAARVALDGCTELRVG